MDVIKRDGRKVDFDPDKVVIAISNANKDVGGKDKISRASIQLIGTFLSRKVPRSMPGAIRRISCSA